MTFTLGPALLIAPPPKMESPEPYDVCLPKGGWYDYWTGERGRRSDKLSETPKLDRLPVFVRAGTILPRQPLVQSTSETPVGPLRLDVYPGPDCTGTIYLDDGHSMAFAKGDYLRQTIHCASGDGQSLVISFDPREGRFAPWWKQIELVVHDRSGRSSVSGSVGLIQRSKNPQSGAIAFSIPDIPNGGMITIGR